jgi:hypothetical protein
VNRGKNLRRNSGRINLLPVQMVQMVHAYEYSEGRITTCSLLSFNRNRPTFQHNACRPQTH